MSAWIIENPNLVFDHLIIGAFVAICIAAYSSLGEGASLPLPWLLLAALLWPIPVLLIALGILANLWTFIFD